MKPRTKVCELEDCQKTFDTFDDRKRFCTRSCAATANNRRKGKQVPCKNCGGGISASGAKVFCSSECRKKFPITEWLSGRWDGTTKDGLSATIRIYLLETAEFKCQDGRSGCNGWAGVNPRSGKSCLTIDHVDGDAFNNSPDNLIVMCPNCHSMTPTYGALNKGSGRAYRYSRKI